MSFDKDLVRSMAEPIVLNLVDERPMYGYEIIKLVNERTDGAFEWKEGTLYPCLHRLESSGLISSQWETSDNGRQRKYYSISRKGKALLKDKVSEWADFSSAVNTLLDGSPARAS
jgi:DNA-binding PadR family transcriptional regulator